MAANYVRDANIDAHPDVYFASTLTDPAQRTPLFPESWFQVPSHVNVEFDAELGVPTLNVHYETNNFSPMILNHRWSQKRGVTVTRNRKNGLQIFEEVSPSQYQALQHPGTPRELYLRYYLNLRRVISARSMARSYQNGATMGSGTAWAITRRTTAMAAARRQDCIRPGPVIPAGRCNRLRCPAPRTQTPTRKTSSR